MDKKQQLLFHFLRVQIHYIEKALARGDCPLNETGVAKVPLISKQLEEAALVAL